MKVKKVRWKAMKAIAGSRMLELEAAQHGFEIELVNISGVGHFIRLQRPNFDDHYVAVSETEWIVFEGEPDVKRGPGRPVGYSPKKKD